LRLFRLRKSLISLGLRITLRLFRLRKSLISLGKMRSIGWAKLLILLGGAFMRFRRKSLILLACANMLTRSVARKSLISKGGGGGGGGPKLRFRLQR